MARSKRRRRWFPTVRRAARARRKAARMTITIGETSHRPPPVVCPGCGWICDETVGVIHDQAPAPGDWSVCIRCFALTRFDDSLERHIVDIDTIEDAETRMTLRKVIAELRQSMAQPS